MVLGAISGGGFSDQGVGGGGNGGGGGYGAAAVIVVVAYIAGCYVSYHSL